MAGDATQLCDVLPIKKKQKKTIHHLQPFLCWMGWIETTYHFSLSNTKVQLLLGKMRYSLYCSCCST